MLYISIFALVVAVVAFLRASNDRYRAAKYLAQLEVHLSHVQHLLQRKGDLANEIAHEIKNPLTAILCSAETLDLLLGSSLPPEHRLSIKYIKEYGEHLLRLVSDFMDISRAEGGHLKCSPEEFEVKPIVESVAGLLKAQALNKNIEVKCVVTDSGASVFMDPRHLKQIIFNLVHNALKFTPADGQVFILVETNQIHGCLYISVQDNGCGIAPENLPKLFELYARFDTGEPQIDVGVGLGLALCKSLVELNGGDISVDSKLGIGTAFYLVFPLVPAKTKSEKITTTSQALKKADTQPLIGQTFLVVDENEAARTAVAKLIEAWGGVVDSVSEATDAVQAIEQRAYDTIMIDEELGGPQLMDLVKRIRNDGSNQTTIIVAGQQPEQAETAYEGAVDGFVSKPLSGNQLLKSLLQSGKYH